MSDPAPEARSAVRELGPVLQAVRADGRTQVILPWGERATPAAGDYILYQGSQVVRTLRAARLGTDYVPAGAGTLTLDQSTLRRIEQTTGFGTAKTAPGLVEAVERLASISIGTVRVEFTPGQLEELQHRATKRGRTVEAEIKAAVDRIKDELFWRG